MRSNIQLWFASAFLLLCITTAGWAQVGINSNGGTPDPSAGLDVNFTDKGTLITRMSTAQRDAISNPADGLMVYNTTTQCFNFFAFGVWQTLGCAVCPTVPVPTAASHTADQSQIEWNWNSVVGATGYKWNTSNDYNTATDVNLATTYTQTGLSCGNSYTLYVWAYTDCGNSAAGVLTQSTSACPCTEGIGGTITYAGGKTIHTFTGNGSFTPPCATNVEVLVVGGGGGGCGGGGGGGGVLYEASHAIGVSPYSVTVGSGGTVNNNGGDSSFDGIIAIGGGGGGCQTNGKAGASGGGGGQVQVRTGGAGTPGQGNNGGNNSFTGGPYPGAGGGGAGGAGQNSQNNSTAGNGGIGLQYSISGSPVYYGGGGGAGLWNTGGTPGSGGQGGGGNGNSGGSGSPGANGRGGGGGGGGQTVGGIGGSGVVIISYPTP